MDLDMLPNWLTGLDQSGWIAMSLMLAFAVITTITVVMIWKLMRQTSKPVSKSDLDEPIPPRKSAPQKPVKTGEEQVDPVAEAEVFLTYGLHKQAINVLEKYLVENPADERASEMLTKARKQA